MNILKKSMIFFFYLLLGGFFGWLLIQSESMPIFSGVYFLSLLLLGIIVGLIVKKMDFICYLGLVFGQIIFLTFLAKPNTLMGIALLLLFLNSIFVLFGNAIGAVIVEKK